MKRKVIDQLALLCMVGGSTGITVGLITAVIGLGVANWEWARLGALWMVAGAVLLAVGLGTLALILARESQIEESEWKRIRDSWNAGDPDA